MIQVVDEYAGIIPNLHYYDQRPVAVYGAHWMSKRKRADSHSQSQASAQCSANGSPQPSAICPKIPCANGVTGRNGSTPSNGPVLSFTLKSGTKISHEELRDLALFSVIGQNTNKPKWAYLRRRRQIPQTLVLRANVESVQMENIRELLPNVNRFFDRKWVCLDEEVHDREKFWKTMFEVPIPLRDQIREKCRAVEERMHQREKYSLKAELILSTEELIDNNYPFPGSPDIVCTKDKYKQVTESSPIFALDCEMCITDADTHELTRISLLREDGTVVLDTLVKPYNKIKDYLTEYSGITPELMKNVTVRLSDCDLRAMFMAHPFCMDSSVLYNINGVKSSKTSLKNLLKEFLDVDMQRSEGHCSIVDSLSALKLIHLKLRNGFKFGNVYYGWTFADWHDQEGDRQSVHGMYVAVAHSLTSTKGPRKCKCGDLIENFCISANCQCGRITSEKCVHCVGKNEIPIDEAAVVDWTSATRTEDCTKSRPLHMYMLDATETVLCAFNGIDKEDVKGSKRFSFVTPGEYADRDMFLREINLLCWENKVCFVELDYAGGDSLASTPGSEEEGEISEEVPDRVRTLKTIRMEDEVTRLLNRMLKHSLLIFVISSPTQSICYIKIKN